MLCDLFPDKGTVSTVEWFILHDHAEQNQKEMCQALQIYPSMMKKILAQLVRQGLIRETRRIAKSRFFVLNKASRLIEPLRALMDQFNHDDACRFANKETEKEAEE